MALLFYDGFEGLSTSSVAATAGAEFGRRYTIPANTVYSNVDPGGRPSNPYTGAVFAWIAGGFGGYCLVASVPGSPATVVVGARLWANLSVASPVTNPILINFSDGSTNHITVTFSNADGSVSARRGASNGTVLGTSATGLVSDKVWAYWEFKVTVDDTNGGVWIRKDGVDVLRLGAFAVSPATLDTRDGAAAQVTVIRWASNHLGSGANTNIANTSLGIDDVYICDTSGVAPYNDFLGASRSIELLPNAAGASAQWTPSAGTNHEAVDDPNIHDGNTTYVESGTAGHRDLYNLTTATVSSVLAVKTIAVARRTDAGPTTIELSVRSGSATADSAGKTLADTFGEHAETFLINPATSASFVPGDLADLQAGVKVPG
jgi:hypothetical protein